MKTHLKNILKHIPDVLEKKILDVGSGGGGFIIDVVSEGGDAFGIEKNSSNINNSLLAAKKVGVFISIEQGVAEELTYSDDSFGFINISEVIEHVEDPDLLLKGVYRVLQKKGFVYLSVPSRFSLKDPHYHLYFINWIPRKMADILISLIGRQKYSLKGCGRQKLTDMHYYTYRNIIKILQKNSFTSIDIREKKIAEFFTFTPFKIWALWMYKLVRPFYFDTFHLLLKKEI